MVLSVDEQVLMAAVEKFKDFECSHGDVDWVRCAAIGVDLAWVRVYKISLRMEPILSIDSDKLFLNESYRSFAASKIERNFVEYDRTSFIWTKWCWVMISRWAGHKTNWQLYLIICKY